MKEPTNPLIYEIEILKKYDYTDEEIEDFIFEYKETFTYCWYRFKKSIYDLINSIKRR